MILMESCVHIAFICDGGYVVPTAAAVRSLSRLPGQRPIDVRIIAVGLSAENEAVLAGAGAGRASVSLLRVTMDGLSGLHRPRRHTICVASESALLKFRLPDLLPDLDKILYLDGDVIVRDDVAALYDTDVSDVYAAVVADSGQIYYKPAHVRRHRRYFNSGVMLLNLAMLRRDGVQDRLIAAKKASRDAMLMDQNAFNEVFDGRVRYLPVRWNFMMSSLVRADDKWTVAGVNRLYGANYRSKRDICEDAAIIHFSSKGKPWCSDDAPGVVLWRDFDGTTPAVSPDSITVSVVIPCYNLANYIERTLKSVFDQTLKNIEVICLDDGSTDETLEILRRIGECQPFMRVVTNPNRRQGFERNMGVKLARGKYVYFMDGDDLLEPLALERLFKRAEKNRLDLIFFEGDAFYESPDIERMHPEFSRIYHRKNFYPGVYVGSELYVRLRGNGDLIVSPCLQFARRDLLASFDELFPEDMPMMEDNLYLVRVLLGAKRVACLTDVLFHRRVRANSTMTQKGRDNLELDAVGMLVKRLGAIAQGLPGGCETRGWVCHHAVAFAGLAEKIKYGNHDLMLSRHHDFETIAQSASEFRADMKACGVDGVLHAKGLWWEGAPLPIRVFFGAVQCYRDNGFWYTIRRVFFGRQY